MTFPLDRRQFLALTAISTLAGCNGHLPGTGPKTIDGDRLQQMATQDAPSVPETLPVAIEASFVADQTDVARQLLAEVPAPFDDEEIPNGAIRQRLNRLSEDARERVSEVADAPTAFERLEYAGHARVAARKIWAGWQAIDTDLTVEAVRENAPKIRADIETFASQWSYLGEDPIRAVRVHAVIERDLRAARTWTTVDDREYLREDGLFSVAEVAEELERARVAIATVTYLFDRFRENLDEASDFQSQLTAARRELGTQVQQRATSLPDVEVDGSPTVLVDRDIEETVGVQALYRLYREAGHATHGTADTSEDNLQPAAAILEATRMLVFIGAFDHLRERIEGGDDVTVSSAADVAALREAAVMAVEAARNADHALGLIHEILPQFARSIEYADSEFENSSGSVSIPHVERDAAEYVVAAETCRVLPDVAAEVATVLRRS